MPREISNDKLLLERMPLPEQELGDIINFAQTFDGYQYWGKECGSIANLAEHYFSQHNKLPEGMTITDIRGCLFFEHRRWRNNSQMMGFGKEMIIPDTSGTELYMRYLVSRIRDALMTKKQQQITNTVSSFLKIGIISSDQLTNVLESLNE